MMVLQRLVSFSMMCRFFSSGWPLSTPLRESWAIPRMPASGFFTSWAIPAPSAPKAAIFSDWTSCP